MRYGLTGRPHISRCSIILFACLGTALAGATEAVAGAEPCGFPVAMQHASSYLRWADMNAVAAYAYVLSEPGINTGSLGIACGDFNMATCLVAPDNFLGDHVIQVKTDWSNPGISGCPLTATGPGRVVVIVVGSDGSGAILSVSGATGEFGYLLDAAHPVIDLGADEVPPVACTGPTMSAPCSRRAKGPWTSLSRPRGFTATAIRAPWGPRPMREDFSPRTRAPTSLLPGRILARFTRPSGPALQHP
jgi:hypothetical protein